MNLAALDLALARHVLEAEAAAILALVDRLNGSFEEAIRTLLDCRGRVIVTGTGKSGIICRKIASTLASTGTPAHFLHPTDAVHGELGVLRSGDVLVAVSNSGETEEIVRLLERVRRVGAKLVAITGSCDSTLGRAADVALDCSVAAEACPLNLVPTASTTAALALGDAIATTLFVAKGFRREDFASLHPGGRLGRRLMRVEQVMHDGKHAPVVQPSTPMPHVVDEMSSKGLGMTCVVDGDALVGVITDGDLRRHMMNGTDLRGRCAADIMTTTPVTIRRDMLASEALHLLELHKITSIVVADAQRRVDGVVHLHDLWRPEMWWGRHDGTR